MPVEGLNKRITIRNKDWAEGVFMAIGSFTFSSNKGQLIPTFVAKLGAEKRDILIAAAIDLRLKNKVYFYRPKNAKPEAVIMVRDVGQLKNTIIPMFSNKMFVHKHIILDKWMETISASEAIPERFKILPKLWKSGFYSKNSAL